MATLDLIGSSPKFQALMTDVETIAPVDSAVLIQGETGTGKEMIARAIHEASPRRSQPFVGSQLCRDSECITRKRAVRARKGCFHRRVGAKPGAISPWRIKGRASRTRSETCCWNFSPSYCAPCKSRNGTSRAAATPYV